MIIAIRHCPAGMEAHGKTKQIKVAEFARHVAEDPPLSPEDLGELAKRMVEAKDSTEADRLQKEIVRGFFRWGAA